MDHHGLLDVSRRADHIDTSFYGYVPDRATSIVFLVLFAISTSGDIQNMVDGRNGCIMRSPRILGWAARLWSSYDPGLAAPYEMQYSRLSPKWYIILFCCCDIISLVVQAIGGGSAATAVSTDGDPEKGGHIMLGGIVFQMATITVYALCAAEFFFRYFSDKPIPGRDLTRGHLTRKLQLLSGAVAFSTVLLFIRAVYRTIELVDGWTGRIIQTEVYFNVLDGAMIIVAIYTVNIFHPGLLLRTKAEKDLDTEMKNVGGSSPMAVPASSSNTTL
ncbi:RTA1 like protein-domain-containing protein [Mucidula mucida]|nr:RTA1 like protein-domain-containing protein [Mucidula mucida]